MRNRETAFAVAEAMEAAEESALEQKRRKQEPPSLEELKNLASGKTPEEEKNLIKRPRGKETDSAVAEALETAKESHQEDEKIKQEERTFLEEISNLPPEEKMLALERFKIHREVEKIARLNPRQKKAREEILLKKEMQVKELQKKEEEKRRIAEEKIEQLKKQGLIREEKKIIGFPAVKKETPVQRAVKEALTAAELSTAEQIARKEREKLRRANLDAELKRTMQSGEAEIREPQIEKVQIAPDYKEEMYLPEQKTQTGEAFIKESKSPEMEEEKVVVAPEKKGFFGKLAGLFGRKEKPAPKYEKISPEWEQMEQELETAPTQAELKKMPEITEVEPLPTKGIAELIKETPMDIDAKDWLLSNRGMLKEINASEGSEKQKREMLLQNLNDRLNIYEGQLKTAKWRDKGRIKKEMKTIEEIINNTNLFKPGEAKTAIETKKSKIPTQGSAGFAKKV